MNILKLTIAIGVFCGSLFASNNGLDKLSKYDHIFAKYESMYGVSRVLMKTIAITENAKFEHSIISQNSNNTVDVGLMQINSKWKEWMPEANITIERLKDPDFNIRVSFIIVRDLINRYGYSWETIGRYHSATNVHKQKWLKRAKSNILMLAELDEKISINRQRQARL